MKVLWITNIMMPPICDILKRTTPVVGGWMFSSLKNLCNVAGLEFGVATVYEGCEFIEKTIDGIVYYLLPLENKKNSIYNDSLENFWVKIKKEYCPDIVHIHGTEYAHGLAYLRSCGNDNVIVSIQGLVSIYCRYYLGGIQFKEILENLTLRDIIRRDSLLHQQYNFYKRGILEQEYIVRSKYFIGRTSWDEAHIRSINPKANYFFCNETLRESFYKSAWNLEKVEKHSIFMSQGTYPIKGLHIMLQAMPIILNKYPEAKLYVAGQNILSESFVHLTGYAKYLRRLIDKNGLKGVVCYTGILDEKGICERYLKSHVFACPSSIENSPNSLGEAQILGVPCVASYVGGVPDMVRSGETGFLYRFEEVEMLADLVCRIFADSGLAMQFSENGRLSAQRRHDPIENTKQLLEIYNLVLNY